VFKSESAASAIETGAHNLKGKIGEKFYYAGGSAKWMFEYINSRRNRTAS
jgi:hypothetical protein